MKQSKQSKPKLLFLVHCEEMFRAKFPSHNFPSKLRRACRDYDRAIALTSMVDIEGAIPEIKDVTEEWEWSWGYEPESFDKQERKHVIPAYGHEWTWVPPELRGHKLREIKKWSVFVGGGYESECLQDFLDVLDHVGVDYTKVRELIY